MASGEQRTMRPAWAWAMALATLVLLGGGGILLMGHVQGRDARAAILGPWPWAAQLAAGAALGLAIAALAWRLIRMPGMDATRRRFAGLVAAVMPGWAAQIAVACCAGVGEELFFRGAIQHWLGIVPTAVAFVALHGYLDPRDKAMLRYGLFLTAAMCLLGLLAEAAGLLLAMAAHAAIDLVLIRLLVRAHASGDRQP